MAIDFDTDNEGGYLDVTTNDVDGGGYGMQFSDASGGGIRFGTVDAASLQLTGGGGVLLTDDSSVGFRMVENGDGGIVLNTLGTTGIILEDDGTYGIALQSATTVDITTSTLAMHSHKITGLADGTAASDAATVGQLPAVGVTKLLYDYTVTGSVKASIDTNNDGSFAGALSTSYRVLEIFLYVRTDDTAVNSDVGFVFNNDASAIYDRQRLRAIGTTVSGATQAGGTAVLASVVGGGSGANRFSPVTMVIPNYAGGVGYTSGTLTSTEADATTANDILDSIGFTYRSTTAISRVKVQSAVANKNLAVGTRLLIYGR